MKKSIRRILFVFIALFSLGIAPPVFAHEFWLAPQDYQPETGDTLQVELHNGQDFNGVEIGYFDKRIEMFDWFQSNARTPVISRAGDFPAMTQLVDQDGLMVLAYESTFSTVQYPHLKKFLEFAAHKGFADAESRHKIRQLTEGRFSEIYTRYCKTLIGVGTSVGQDVETGLETEFVAQTNPYTDDVSKGVAVTLFYQGAPRINAQIEVFERAPDQTVKISTQHTDAKGQALIAVKPAHTYLLDAVVLRDPDETLALKNDAVWETLWASMTFFIPQ